MFLVIRLVALAVLAASLFVSAVAEACSYQLGPKAAVRFPNWETRVALPSNLVFIDAPKWQTDNGKPLSLALDRVLSDRIALEALRPTAGLLTSGQRLRTGCRDQEPCSGDISIFGEPDTVAPQRASIRSLDVVLKTDPADTGAFSCPDTDRIELVVDGTDDRCPLDHLALVAWLGGSDEEATSKQQADITFTFDRYDIKARRATIVVGESVGRRRDGAPFRSAEPFCFTIALMDWAGNIGPRSEPACIHTRDPSHPHTRVEPGQRGCLCTTAPGNSPAQGWALLAIIAGLVVRRRQAATRPPRDHAPRRQAIGGHRLMTSTSRVAK